MALHEVQLKGYSVRPGNLSLGTFDSYGIEQLHVTLDDTWSGLAVTATFNPPKGEPVEIRVPENGLIDVPAEATANEGTGSIVYCGVANGVQLITKTQGYNVITHANVGGTEPFNPSESLATQVLQAALKAEKNSAEANTAAQSAQTAAESATAAAQASAESASKAAAEAAAAKPYAESAKASAEAARNSENQAQQSSAEANTAKNAAQNAQAGAESSATSAAKSAKEAAASAVNMDSAVNTATQKAAAASASATAAKASESAAASSEAAARKYANSAESAANTAGEAAAAATKAKTAAESAQADAAASKTAAANSATQANQSANAAANSAIAAETSEDAAAKSAADANSTANSIKDSMTQIAANKDAVSQLKEDTTALKKRQNVLVGSETGNPVSCNDAYSAPLCGLTVYGKSTQDGTPSPDAPIPIVSAGDSGSVTVKATGANILYLPDIEESTVGGITYSVKNGVIKIKGTSTGKSVRLLRNIKLFIGTWIFNPNPVKGTESSNCYLDLTNSITIGVSIKNNNTNKPIKMTESYVKYPFYLNIESTAGSVIDMEWKPQMLLSDKLLPYSPYREQLLTLPTPNGLPGIPVTSGGNYTDPSGQQWVCDEVDLERGVKVQRVKRVDISSLDKSYWDFRSDTGANTSSTRYKNDAVMIDFKSNAPAMNNILPVGVANIKNTFRLVATPLYLYQFNLDASEFPTVKSWTEYLEANTVLVIYALAIPIETPLTPAEIAAYKALTTYAPDTVVQASDDAGIKLCYQRDVNLVVKNLEDAIASMTTT